MTYLTEAQLSERWCLSRRSLQQLRKDGRLAYTQITPRRVLYQLDEIERFEREQANDRVIVGITKRRQG